jgi:hypothetical protein
MLNLITVLHAFIKSRYSTGMSVLLAALSKKSFTYSKKRGSLCSSSFGPKFFGSMGSVLVVAENLKRSKIKIRGRKNSTFLNNRTHLRN